MEGGWEGRVCPLQHIHSTVSVLNTPSHSSLTLFLFFPNASHREKCAGPIFAQKWCWDRQITYQYLSLASHAPNSHPPPVQLIDWLGKKLGPLSSDQGHTTHGLCATHPPPHPTPPPPLQHPPQSLPPPHFSQSHDAHTCMYKQTCVDAFTL